MIRLCIVDDDPLVTGALKTILGATQQCTVIGVFHTGEQLIAAYPELQPDIVLMDIRMQGITGIETGQKILTEFPQVKILFLTTFSDDEYIIQALKMGARGYLLKQNFDSLMPALIAVSQGQRVFGEAIAEKLPRFINSEPGATAYTEHGLNEREYQILKCVADGLSNREISNTIYLGEGTVRNYISTILEKLELRDRTQLAIYYYRNFT